ncbi:hypothetical protein [Pontibacter kalidii]|uniref:hypothetical protein n=1 Tax=Pontibacter kalidii TaxID=2592049 RepID=UPI00224FA4F2|nr:hypothetical protein [Pontibacter kalidii]
MEKQNPFSVYDFLGYLIPGSVLIYSLHIINQIENPDRLIFKELTIVVNDFQFEKFFVLIVFSYILGHFISFFSSITIERYANWKYSFPSKYLLGMNHKGYWKTARNWTDYGWRIVLVIILAPCVTLDYFLGPKLAFSRFYQQSMDPFLQDITKSKIRKLINHISPEHSTDLDDEKLSQYDFHRIVTHYSYETSRNHQSRMSNYVALFGFLRNTCLIFNVLTIYSMAYMLLNGTDNLIFPVMFTLATYLSFMAFMKFYRRYSLEGFMVLLISNIERTVPNHT